MRHTLLTLVLIAATASTAVAAPRRGGELGEAVLPGGLEAARALLQDRTAPSRAFFLVEFIRRFYDTPRETPKNQQPRLQAMLASLEEASRTHTGGETVPLPFTPEWWRSNVFEGTGSADSVVLDILRSRDAALLYCGLVALEPGTRAWFEGQRPLVKQLVRGRAALLVVGAPGVRVTGGRFVPPGGEPLRKAWETLVGAPVTDPAAFLARVFERDDVLAYFLGRLGLVGDRELAAAVGAGADPPGALGRLYRVFARAAEGWQIAGRPFSSMPDDPVLLLLDICAWRARGASVPGSDRFWTAVFAAGHDVAALPDEADLQAGDGTAELTWLLDQVVRPSSVDTRLRMAQVRFAVRVFGSRAASSWRDRAIALVALGPYPALVRSLERAHIADETVYRAAIERVQSIRGIDQASDEARATAQFQGALALAMRAASRGPHPAESAADLITSLAAVPLGATGEYGDGIASWLHARLGPEPDATPARPPNEPSAADEDMDGAAAHWVTAYPASPTPIVSWEGTRYRLDLAYADTRRLEQVRAERVPTYLSSAWRLFEAARRLEGGPLGRNAAAREADALDAIAQETRAADEDGDAAIPEVIAASRTLRGASRAAQPRQREAASAVRRAGEALTARGLTELTYAAALGGSDRLPVTSFDAAARHDFGFARADEPRGALAWRMPAPAVRTRGPWHIEGSLLALDVCLAETWLRRTSQRPLAVPPSVDRADRRTMSEVIVTMDPLALDDASRDGIAEAIRVGRARAAAFASAEEVEAAASALPLDRTVGALLPWIFIHERERLAGALSPLALLRLGASASARDIALEPWGAPARPRQGCICLEVPRYAPDHYMGYLSSGVLMGAVPDLNLRLAEWMHALAMPAPLLPGLLAGATMTLVDRAPIRYPDDLRAFLEQIDRVSLDDAEQYLAMLTTDGPLVPVAEGVPEPVTNGGGR